MSQQRQQVYCSLVRSVLEYAVAALANLTNYKANDFKKIQKRPLIIFPFTLYEDALAKAGIASSKKRCQDACVNFVKQSSL